MLAWLSENISTIIVCLILAFAVFMVIRKMVKDKKSGKSGCGCGCESCAMHSVCSARANGHSCSTPKKSPKPQVK